MCNFCTQHGDGQKWYLQAKNYAADLASDLRRRTFMQEFVEGFDNEASVAVASLERLRTAPSLVRSLASKMATRRMKLYHFGQPVPLEDCERIFQITTSIVRVPCVCRHAAHTPNDALCLAITTRPYDDDIRHWYRDFEAGPDTSAFDNLTDVEALALLKRCEEEGMMHSVWTFITPFIAGLCNCKLTDGCLALRSTLEFGMKSMWKGEYIAGVDRDLCVGCQKCVKLCPFQAIEFDEPNRKAQINPSSCYGCGTCRTACAKEAISLTERVQVPAVARNW